MARIVKATELKTARRGRTAKRIASVLEAMAGLKDGDAIILDEYGEVAEDEKSRVYQSVKAHWADVRQDACRISFDPTTNMVQVEPKAPKAKGKASK